MSLYRFIASKIRSEGRASSSSTTIGMYSVAISVAVIIVAIAVVRGFRSEIMAKASGFMGEVALVAPGQTPMNEKFPFSFKSKAIDGMEHLQEVDAIYPVAYTSGLLKSEDDISGALFKGVDSLYNLVFFESVLVEGEIPTFNGRLGDKILISKRMADKMGYAVGDRVLSYFIDDEVRLRRFTVSGIYHAQLENIDNMLVLVDIRHVRRINGWDTDDVSTVEIDIARGCSLSNGERAVDDYIFLNTTDDDEALFVTNIERIFAHLFDWLRLLDFNVLIILILMIIVAGFNMISTLLIILFERISAIGLLKSLGMTTAQVARVFQNVALNIVLKGLAIGNILSLVICYIQEGTNLIKLDAENYFVKAVPIDISLFQVFLIDIVSVGVIALFLTVTTLFISRVSPDKTMRVE